MGFLLFSYIFLESIVLQKFPCCPSIPPVQQHNLPNEFSIFLANLLLRLPIEWRRLWLWNLLHEIQYSLHSLPARNFFVLAREWTEVLELPFKDFDTILFMS